MKHTIQRGCFRRRLAAILPLGVLALLLAFPPIAGCSGPDGAKNPPTALSPSQRDSVDAFRRVRVEEMYRKYHRDFPEVRDVTPDSLMAWLQHGEAVLVDVRKAKEIAVSRIPGSITKDEYAANRQDFAGRKVVSYCTIGYRSGKFTRELARRGVDAYNLFGGILYWVHTGGEVIDAEGPVATVHVYGRQWSLLPVGYKAVW